MLALCLLLLNGCATLSKEQCSQGDWYRIGYQNGAEGRPASIFDKHQKACGEYNIRLDQGQYKAGRKIGLTYHCSNSHDAAKQGKAIRKDRGDWYAIGHYHGMEGFHLKALKQARQSCKQAKIAVNVTAYQKGRAIGIVKYCDPDNAYRVGSQGLRYQHSCPKNQKSAFLDRYMNGLDKAINQANTKLRGSDNNMSFALSQLSDEKDKEKRDSLLSSVEYYRQRSDELKDTLRRLRELYHDANGSLR